MTDMWCSGWRECDVYKPYVMVLHVKSIKLQSIWCNTSGVGKLGGKWHCSQNPVIRFPPQGDPLILCTWFASILEEEVTLGHVCECTIWIFWRLGGFGEGVPWLQFWSPVSQAPDSQRRELWLTKTREKTKHQCCNPKMGKHILSYQKNSIDAPH